MDGIIIINKPQNCTSHDIVYKIKKITNQKVGHTGTLDPLAEGVLPILIGKATRCSKYLINHNKKYIVKLKLGVRTDTLDEEGNIIEKKNVNSKIMDKINLENTLKTFIGKQTQVPPIYSAIKVNGKKLYEYARKGQKVEIPKREINIYEIDLLNIDKQEKIIEFKVFCSKGTYIRTLCEDIAKKLGTIGYMKNLKRVEVGNFSIEQSISIQEFENDIELKKEIEKKIINLENLFADNPKIELKNKELTKFLNGGKIIVKKENGVYSVFERKKIYRNWYRKQ